MAIISEGRASTKACPAFAFVRPHKDNPAVTRAAGDYFVRPDCLWYGYFS